MTHEKNVETFYSKGSEIGAKGYSDRDHRTWEFLSFGYWQRGTRKYLDAAENLIDFFLHKSEISKPGRMLSVACGYGTETFSCFETFKPSRIDGIDVTKKHVDYSNAKAKLMRIDDKVFFHHGNACALDFPKNTFSHIIGIEGPVHFSTRNAFFGEAKRVLKSDGDLILTDIILGRSLKSIGSFNKKILRFLAGQWFVPDTNWVEAREYRKQLQDVGFKSIHIEKIGKHVFPGYAHNALVMDTIRNRLKQRGIRTTIGLTIISYMLGYLFKRRIIEYIFVRAGA
jgi:ubiquinone/menaquinone biosynthesis C-methylase UbiE